MDLLCSEKMTDGLASADPVIFSDQRVLDILLESEIHYIPRCNYFQQVQTDLKPFMRKVVATWMMEVCEEECCEPQVFSTAINLLDRFLCECRIDKSQLQMVACVCLLVASKVRQCHALSVAKLVFFTDYSVTADQIRQFEVVVLSRINWDLSSVTGYDYVDHVLQRVCWPRDLSVLRRHARVLVDICYAEAILFRQPPSLIGSACVLSAARGFEVPEATVHSLCSLTRCSPEALERAVSFVDHLVDSQSNNAPAAPRQPPPSGSSTSKLPPATEDDTSHGPDTPTDVQEIFF